MTLWGFGTVAGVAVTVAMAAGECTIRVSSSLAAEALKEIQEADKVGL